MQRVQQSSSFRFMKGVLSIKKANVHAKTQRVFCGGGYRVPKQEEKKQVKAQRIVRLPAGGGGYSSVSNLSIARSSSNFPITSILKEEIVPQEEEDEIGSGLQSSLL